ncbi:hypothetical protein ACFQGE_11050 [Halomicroarcula sp. GCM10025817]|nr:hypothetical protein [Halomicroarcula sp. SYNS111]
MSSDNATEGVEPWKSQRPTSGRPTVFLRFNSLPARFCDKDET